MANSKDSIVFNYQQMAKCVETLKALETSYKKAGESFETAMDSAITDWTGASKDAFAKFMKGSVHEYTIDFIPELMKALHEMLQANIDQMGDADAKIAESLSGNGEG